MNRLLLSLAVFACGGVSAMDFVDLQKPTMVQIDGAPAGEAVSVGADGWIHVKRAEPLSWVTLTWNVNLGAGTKVLGGEWERTYGDSEWHRLDRPEEKRPRKGAMPWYFLATDGLRTDGYGVETQPNVFASWHATVGCVRLVLDCRAGSRPVRLGTRTLAACRLVSRRGAAKESAFAAGLFDIQRTGDDTSGLEWSRTRKMGPNTLAVRAIHDGAFYRVDADCFCLTRAGKVPRNLNLQWLDLVSSSGTTLFVSLRRQLITREGRVAIERAMRRAAKPQPIGGPLDWLETLRPTRWQCGDEIRTFHWE